MSSSDKRDRSPNLPTFPAFRSGIIFEDLAHTVTMFAEGLKRLAHGFFEVLGKAVYEAKRAELIEASGWLPHYTSPFEAIDMNMAAADIEPLIERHYRDNWANIRAEMEARLDAYDLDEEAKATFREAFGAHEQGFYRAVVRMLFPEIERVAREEIYDGKHYEERDPPQTEYLFWLNPDELAAPARQITSLAGLRKVISSLPAGAVGNFRYGFSLYQRIQTHLYKSVGSKPQHVRKYERDAVPNRHATLHGLVSYKSHKNSVNALIMADFMFHCISGIKKLVRERSEAAAVTTANEQEGA